MAVKAHGGMPRGSRIGLWQVRDEAGAKAKTDNKNALAVPAAGYVKSQSYVPLILSRWDIPYRRSDRALTVYISSAHYIDPVLRSVLESSLTPDDNDLFMSNLANTPILAVHGSVLSECRFRKCYR
jgi:hypothetical protein